MSSTYQFESGLNDWIDTDKPTRADFVRDNSILTEKVMWTEDYDPAGEVGAVGIPEYVSSRLSDDTGWLPLAGLNGATSTAAYRKMGNIVCLKGVFSGCSIGTVMANLPMGFRPSSDRRFIGASVSSNLYLTMYAIEANGNITPVATSGGMSIDVSQACYLI